MNERRRGSKRSIGVVHRLDGGEMIRVATAQVSKATPSLVIFARKSGGASRGSRNQNASMRGVKKENLPSKICVVCDRPFTWRKKWENCWDEVTTCSKACNAQRRRDKREDKNANKQAGGDIYSHLSDSEQNQLITIPKESRTTVLSLPGQKPCGLCERNVDLLIRCQVDQSRKWKMVCGGCWKKVSGGQTDGDSDHPYYKYGGLWKNRKASS